jgi:DNA-binding response OmpR family regulator
MDETYPNNIENDRTEGQKGFESESVSEAFFRNSTHRMIASPQDEAESDHLDSKRGEASQTFHHEDLSRYASIFDEMSDINQIKVRYISSNDQFKSKRDAWVTKLIKNMDYYNFNYYETHSISKMNGDYDVVIIGGNDSSRIGRFIRDNHALIGGHPKIAVMTGSDPRRRAQLLNAGFDDVLDSMRTQADEALFRISSIWRRYDHVNEIKLEQENVQRQISNIIRPNMKPSSAEFRIISELINRSGKIVSYDRLMIVASRGYEKISTNHLKVLISNLRKKLNDDYKITSSHNFGYALVKL